MEPVYLYIKDLKMLENISNNSPGVYNHKKRFSHISQKIVSNIIHNVFKIDRKKQIFSRTSFGKLFLVDFTNIFFNLSYAGTTCFFIFSRQGPVGIDAEENHKRMLKPLDLVSAFHPEEYKFFLGNTEKGISNLLYKTWVIKEATIKTVGQGFHFDIRQLNTIPLLSRKRESVFASNKIIWTSAHYKHPFIYSLAREKYPISNIISLSDKHALKEWR